LPYRPNAVGENVYILPMDETANIKGMLFFHLKCMFGELSSSCKKYF